jgi:hypothetical protein
MLVAKLPAGEMLTADDIRVLCPGEFLDGRMGDILIAGLMRQAGIERTSSNSRHGYVIPVTPGNHLA